VHEKHKNYALNSTYMKKNGKKIDQHSATEFWDEAKQNG